MDRPNDVADLFDFGNAQRVARDIVNQPRSGATGIHVGGRVVYHSSAGSGSTNDPGSAFWVVEGDMVYVVAVGRHIDGHRARYRLYEQADGVDISNVPDLGYAAVDLDL